MKTYLEPTLLAQAATQLFPNHTVKLIPQLTSNFDSTFSHILISFKTVLDIDEVSNKHYVDNLANALAIQLISLESSQNPSKPHSTSKLSEQQLQQVIDHIHVHVDQDIRLADLSDIVHLSTFHFARLFKQSMGLAPHQYHVRCRIERAKQLLLEGQSIVDVAYTVGFSSQGHFSYQFKHWVGVTPRVFLRQQ